MLTTATHCQEIGIRSIFLSLQYCRCFPKTLKVLLQKGHTDDVFCRSPKSDGGCFIIADSYAGVSQVIIRSLSV